MTPQEQITGKVDDLPEAASLGDDPLATLSKEAHSYGLKLTSNLRLPAKNRAAGGASNSYHLEGAGYDFSGDPQAMKAFTQHMQETYGPSLRELYHDPVGGWKNGQSVGPIGGHTNHVHIAAYPQIQGNVNDLPDTPETAAGDNRVAGLLAELTDPNRPANRNAQARPVKQFAPRKVPGEALSQQFEEAKAKGDLVSAGGYAAQLKQKGWEVGADEYGNPYVKPPKGYQYQTTQPSLQTDLLSGQVNAPAPPSPTVLQQLGSGIERMSGGVYSGLGSGVAGTGKLLHFKPTEELGQTMMGMGGRLTRQAQEHGSTGVVGDVLGAAGEVLPLLTLPGGATAIGAAGGLQSYGRGATLPEAALQGAATGIGVAGGGALASKIGLKGLSGLAARSVAATAGMEVPQIALTGHVPTAREVLPNLLLMGGLEAMHGTPERIEGHVADLPETEKEAKLAESPMVVPEQIQGHVNELPDTVSAGKGLPVEGEGLGVPAVQPRVPPQQSAAEPATVVQQTPSLEPQVSAASTTPTVQPNATLSEPRFVTEARRRREAAAGTVQPNAKPEWVQSNIDARNSIAERAGIADQIEELSAQGKTAREIANTVAPKLNATDRTDAIGTVYAVKAKRGIPSMDDKAEFETWRNSRIAPALGATERGGTTTVGGATPPSGKGDDHGIPIAETNEHGRQFVYPEDIPQQSTDNYEFGKPRTEYYAPADKTIAQSERIFVQSKQLQPSKVIPEGVANSLYLAKDADGNWLVTDRRNNWGRFEKLSDAKQQAANVLYAQDHGLLVMDAGKKANVESPSRSTETARPVAEQVEHHSELQPRDPETQQFAGPPEGYTPKAEQEGKQRSLPKTLEEANLPGGTNRTYEQISNESSLAKAEQNIKTKGLNGAAEWVKGEAEPSAEHTATGLKVISELQKAGRYDDAVDVASDLSDKLTKQGQAIQAVQVLNQLSPERALLVAERLAKKYKTRVDAKAITEKAATAQADDARLKFLESEVERLTNEAAKSAPKKTAKGLNGRLNERAQNALAKLQGRPVDLKGISQGAELGAVTVGRPPLQGDAELLAEYGASTLDKPMDDWKADLRSRFGDISDAQLDTIVKRAYDIRSEERVNDLAERIASGDVKTKRSAGAEIGQGIRDAEKAAKQAERAAAKAKRQTIVQDADTAARAARIQEGLRLDAEKEDARQKLAGAWREGIEAKRQADKLERERIANEKDAAKKTAQWTAPFQAAADAARQAKTDEPMSLDDATAVAADIIAPKTPQESVARGLTAARFYKEIEAQTGVDRKTAKEAFKRAYQRVSDARTAAREAARISAATGGQAGALTDAQLQSVLAQREAAQRDANRSRQDLASEFQKLQMTTPQRVVYNLVRGSRQVLLSGITGTAETLSGFGLLEQVARPARDLIGAGWKGIAAKDSPLGQMMAGAPREGAGFNVRAQAAGQAKFFRTMIETWTPGKSDVRNYFKTGHLDIDKQFGKANSLPPEVTELFGLLHGAIKTPTRLAEFEVSSRMRLEDAIAKGLDPTDPTVVLTAMQGATMDSLKVVMLADNAFSDMFSAAKRSLREGRPGGKAHPYAAMGVEFLNPISKIPPNIFAEAGRYIGGLPKSIVETLYYGTRGTIEQLPVAEKERIIGNLKKGTLGALLIGTVFAFPKVLQFGGHRKPGEKDEDLPQKPESIQLFGVNMPFAKALGHHPLVNGLQSVATFRRVLDKYGLTDAMLTTSKQSLEHLPYVGSTAEALEALGGEHQWINFAGTLLRSRIEPPDLQKYARIQDQPDTTVGSKVKQFFGLTPEEQATRRYPATMGEMMQMGIPGQREKVPVISVSRTIQTPTATHYLSDAQYAELRKATSDSVNEAMKTARSKLSDLTPKQRLAASQYITSQIMSRERDRLKLKLDKAYADSAAGDNAFDRLHQPLEEIISDARDKLSEGKFNRKQRVVQQ